MGICSAYLKSRIEYELYPLFFPSGLEKTMAGAIIPLPLTDQASPARDIIIQTCLIVAGRLDPQVLIKALATLVNKWPILGSRLVRNKKVCV